MPDLAPLELGTLFNKPVTGQTGLGASSISPSYGLMDYYLAKLDSPDLATYTTLSDLYNARTDKPVEGNRVSPSQAKEQYGIEIDRDVTPAMASLIQARLRDEKRVNDILATLDNGAASIMATGALANLTVAAADPLNWAIGASLGAGAGILGVGARALPFSSAVTDYIASRGALRAFSGAVGGASTALIDAEIQNQLMKEHATEIGTEFSEEEANNNRLGALLLGGALGGILGYFKRGSKRVGVEEDVDYIYNGKTPNNARQRLLDIDMEQPRNVKSERVAKAARKAYGEADIDTFYSVFTKEGDIHDLGSGIRGRGATIVGDVGFAHRAAATSLEPGSNGKVLTKKVQIGKLKFLDLEDYLPPDVADKVYEVLSRKINNEQLNDLLSQAVKQSDGKSIIDVVDKLDNLEPGLKLFDDMEDILADNFDGYVFSLRKSDGSVMNIDNPVGYKIFDIDKFEIGNVDEVTFNPRDPDAMPDMGKVLKEEAKYLDSPESDISFNPDSAGMWDEVPEIPKVIDDVEYHNELKTLVDEELANSKKIAKELEKEVPEFDATVDPREVAKAAIKCVKDSL